MTGLLMGKNKATTFLPAIFHHDASAIPSGDPFKKPIHMTFDNY